MRALWLLAAFALPVGCFSATELALPAAPPGARSLFVARSCDLEIELSAHHIGDPVPLQVEACPGQLEYHFLFSPRTLEALRLEPGPMRVGPCPAQLEPCCLDRPFSDLGVDAPYSARIEGGSSSTLERMETLPSAIANLRYQRSCRCPVMSYRAVEARPTEYERVRVAANERGEVLLSLARVRRGDGEPTAFDSLVFRTTLEALRTDGWPRDPLLQLPGEEVGSVDLSPEGEVTVGLATSSDVLLGRLGEPLVRVALPLEGATSRFVAHNPAVPSPVEIAIAGDERRTEILFRRGESWRVVDGADQMRGTCSAPPALPEQKSWLSWTSDGAALFMPRSQDMRTRAEVTPQTAPDGFFRVRGDSVEWVRPEHAPLDCLTRVIHAPELGILVATEGRRILLETDSGWLDLDPPLRAGLAPLRRELDLLAPFPGGFAFGGSEGVFGFATEDLVCEQAVIGTTHLERLTWSGQTILAAGNAPSEGIATIYLIDLDWP